MFKPPQKTETHRKGFERFSSLLSIYDAPQESVMVPSSSMAKICANTANRKQAVYLLQEQISAVSYGQMGTFVERLKRSIALALHSLHRLAGKLINLIE